MTLGADGLCQGGSHRQHPCRVWEDESTIYERKARLEMTTDVGPDQSAADTSREQPEEKDHMPPEQIADLLADMEPGADAPQDPPLDAKTAALTEERKGAAEDDR